MRAVTFDRPKWASLRARRVLGSYGVRGRWKTNCRVHEAVNRERHAEMPHLREIVEYGYEIVFFFRVVSDFRGFRGL